MSGQILSTIGLVTSATLLVSGIAFGVAHTAHAENCLTAPNSSAPQGSHWYYHLDQANQRKCWYVRKRGQPAQQATAEATSEAVPVEPSHAIPKPTDSSAGAPTLIGPSDVAPPLPHAEMLAAALGFIARCGDPPAA